MRVLEVGCGDGDPLAALQPAYGVGIDFCPEMVKLARERHPDSHFPGLHFIEGDAHDFDLGQAFDYIVCADLLNDVWDVQQVFERIGRHCRPGTKAHSERLQAAFGNSPGAWLKLPEIAALPQMRAELARASDDIVNLMGIWLDFGTDPPLVRRFFGRSGLRSFISLPISIWSRWRPSDGSAWRMFFVARPRPQTVEAEPVVTVAGSSSEMKRATFPTSLRAFRRWGLAQS